MDLYGQTIAEWGGLLGMDGLTPDGKGVLALDMEMLGRVQIERREHAIFVTLARDWPAHAARAALTALAVCSWRENHPWPINPGAAGNSISLTASLSAENMTVHELDKLLEYLPRLMDRIEEAG